MDLPLSFIVPIYNTGTRLARCLNSLLAVPVNKEIILIDDGSTDGSLDIAKQYAQTYGEIKLLQQPNSGVSVARNNGLSIAQGKYVQFVDSDDVILSQEYYPALISMADMLNVDMVRTMIEIHYERADFLKHDSALVRLPVTQKARNMPYLNGHLCSGMDYLNEFLSNWFPSPCNGVYLRERLTQHKIAFPNSVILAEDSLFNTKFLSLPNIQVLDIKVSGYAYCHRSESASHQSAKPAHIQSVCTLTESFLDFLDELNASQQASEQLIRTVKLIMKHELRTIFNSRYPLLTETDKLLAQTYFNDRLLNLIREENLNIQF